MKFGSGTHIEANSVVDGAVVGEECQVGPFARLRPGTELAARAKVGARGESARNRAAWGGGTYSPRAVAIACKLGVESGFPSNLPSEIVPWLAGRCFRPRCSVLAKNLLFDISCLCLKDRVFFGGRISPV